MSCWSPTLMLMSHPVMLHPRSFTLCITCPSHVFYVMTRYEVTEYVTPFLIESNRPLMVYLHHWEYLKTLPTCAGNITQLKEFSNLTMQLPDFFPVLSWELIPWSTSVERRGFRSFVLFARVNPRAFQLLLLSIRKEGFPHTYCLSSWLLLLGHLMLLAHWNSAWHPQTSKFFIRQGIDSWAAPDINCLLETPWSLKIQVCQCIHSRMNQFAGQEQRYRCREWTGVDTEGDGRGGIERGALTDIHYHV